MLTGVLHAPILNLPCLQTKARSSCNGSQGPALQMEGASRDVLLLDIALDNYFRLCIERADKSSMAGDDFVNLASLVLKNAVIAYDSRDLQQVDHITAKSCYKQLQLLVTSCFRFCFEGGGTLCAKETCTCQHVSGVSSSAGNLESEVHGICYYHLAEPSQLY